MQRAYLNRVRFGKVVLLPALTRVLTLAAQPELAREPAWQLLAEWGQSAVRREKDR